MKEIIRMKEVSLRGNVNPVFRTPCYRELYTLLGQADSSIEWIEVIIRDFEHQSKKHSKEYIEELPIKYDVKVNDLDFMDLKKHWSKLRILSVYQAYDNFLVSLTEEHPREILRKKEREEDYLSYIFDIYKLKKSDFGVELFEILNYYRLVRNKVIHPQSTQRLPRIKKFKKYVAKIKEVRNLDAPNSLDQLSFHDFLLFTRLVKHFADYFYTKAMPTNEEFFELVLKDKDILMKLKAKDEKKQIKYLSHYLFIKYIYDKDKAKNIAIYLQSKICSFT